MYLHNICNKILGVSLGKLQHEQNFMSSVKFDILYNGLFTNLYNFANSIL